MATTPTPTPTTSSAAVFGRLFWMMLGPLTLGVTIYYILTSGTGWRTVADILFFAILGGMILGRWLEFLGGTPQTSTGEPATPKDLRRYVLLLVIAGPIVWLLANVIGNHLLSQIPEP